MRRMPPLMTVVLVAMWLLLNASASLAHILLGLAIAVLLLLASAQLRPLHPRIKRLWTVVPLIARVFVDIVRSNVGVAKIVLGLTGGAGVHSGFVDIPLEMRDPHGLAILAAIITATPGTAWAGVSEDGHMLKLHVLDLKDESEWIRTIKQRYEQPLMRIFE